MICKTLPESKLWLSELLGEGTLDLSKSDPLKVPKDAGKKMALAKSLISSNDWANGGLLLITGYGIWPSCENQGLFYGYRKSFGELRDLKEAPGHLIQQDVLEQTEAVLALCLYFMWDTLLVSVSDKLLIQLDHHEHLVLAGLDPKIITERYARYSASFAES